MKKYLILALFFITNTCLNAQLFAPKLKNIEELQRRKLIVVVESIDDKTAEKLQKKDSRFLKNYKDAVKAYNEDIKETLTKHWKWHKTEDILFKTWDEVTQLYEKGKKEKKYAVLSCFSITPRSTSSGVLSVKGLKYYDGAEDDASNIDWSTQMSIKLLEDWKGWFSSPVMQVDMPFVFPKKAEIFYGINTMLSYFESRLDGEDNGDRKDEMKKNQARLKKKTLVLLDQWVPEKLSDTDIRKAYHHKFKVVDYKEFERIIIEKDENYAFVMVVPHVLSTSQRNTMLYYHAVIDAKDFSLLGMHKPNGLTMSLTGGFAGTGRSMITEKTLKDYIEYLK